MHLVNEILQHFLGHGEVGDHAILHGSNGRDVARRSAQHGFSLGTYGSDRFLAPDLIFPNRHHRRFIENDAFPLTIDQGIGCSKVDGKVGRIETPKLLEKHGILVVSKTTNLASEAWRWQGTLTDRHPLEA